MGKRHRPKKRLLPFFDRLDNPELHHFPPDIAVDITPPPPTLAPFDQDVLRVCGKIGSRIHPPDFQALLSTYPEILDRIQAAVDGEIFPGRHTSEEFLADLTQIWFRHHGFEHIFCGSIRKGKIKGMHYVGRYLQLQEQGLAGKLPRNQSQEEVIEGAAYTIGVLLRYGNRVLVDRRTGYALVTDAAELLIAATQAFKTQDRSQSVCTFPVIDADSGQTYPAVFVKKDDAIVTFYPDVTPTDPQC
jgi:Bacterial EndoU nuclease